MDYIKVIENNDYKIISGEYKNSYSKLTLQCPNNHIFEMRYTNFQQGHRCPLCASNYRRDINLVKETILKNDLEWLDGEYKNSYSKLKVKCLKGHIYHVIYNNIQKGSKCPYCSTNHKKTDDEVNSFIQKKGFKWIGGIYQGSHSKLDIQCSEGHVYTVKYNNFQQGNNCPICTLNKKWSKPEKEIVEYVKTIYSGEIIENDRTQIINHWTGKNLELDVWLPEIKIAIEFNGEYWHKKDKAKWYEEMKKKQCKIKNINLLIINDSMWYDNKENVIKYIDSYISLFGKRLKDGIY